ncbi:aminopeptidase P family protein [Archangium violaceum]|uniref:M24 family metallopeptidase n=1 Tax=Archangium violaceum TaxID=83451 RepID=UPI0019526EEF|nr:Xaa-Pro peptidase family protein [Archangium violaceum]QRN93709.1 aminopeptidase P family protein [Archangium violaceum]
MIPRGEYLERMERLRQKVAEAGLDAFLVTSEDSIYYLTGVSYRPLERPFFILVRPGGPPVLLVPALERQHLRAAPNVEEVLHYWDYPAPAGQGWADRLLELLAGHTRVGLEPSLSQEIAGRLAHLSPRVLPLIEELRVVKSAAEVRMLRDAARYSDAAVGRLLAASYHGVSVLELFSQGRSVQLHIMRESGYDVLTSSVLVGSWPAPLSAQPHGVPSIADRLEDGPHIALAFLRVNGYAAECERTYFLSPPRQEERAAFAAMMEARRRAFALVRPGVACAELDATARDFLHQEGYGDRLLHRTGHGFGLGNHEAPWVADGSTDVLRENMLISIEPGIYLPGVGGIRHSDTVLVTRDGYESLTRYPTDLASMTVTASKRLNRLKGVLLRRAAGVK